MNWVNLTEIPINISDVVNFLIKPNCGAISIFFGTTREDNKKQLVSMNPSNETKPLLPNICVDKLFYEAYNDMAIKEMENLCDQIRSGIHLNKLMGHKNDHEFIGNLVILHRLGYVHVGEISVCVAASSLHRKEAQDSTKFMIEQLKKCVPIWKKEIYNDGTSEWKPNKFD